MNLSSFGEYITKLRKKRKLSQEEIAFEIDISSRQYKRIENNISRPSLSTLEKFTKYYKINITEKYINFLNKDLYTFNSILSTLFIILDKKDIKGLNNFINSIDINSKYDNELYKQAFLFSKSIISLWNEDYLSAKQGLIESLKITIENYDVNKFNEFIYTDFEFRILLNIGFCYRKINNNNLDLTYTSILKFINDSIDEQSSIYENIKYNYINYYLYNKNFKFAEKESLKVLKKLTNNNQYNNIFRFYYLTGVSKLYNKDISFKEYFDNCLKLLEIYNLKDQYCWYKDKIDIYLKRYEMSK